MVNLTHFLKKQNLVGRSVGIKRKKSRSMILSKKFSIENNQTIFKNKDSYYRVRSKRRRHQTNENKREIRPNKLKLFFRKNKLKTPLDERKESNDITYPKIKTLISGEKSMEKIQIFNDESENFRTEYIQFLRYLKFQLKLKILKMAESRMKFDELKTLGSGKNSQVYLMSHRKSGKLYAGKVILKNKVKNEKELKLLKVKIYFLHFMIV